MASSVGMAAIASGATTKRVESARPATDRSSLAMESSLLPFPSAS